MAVLLTIAQTITVGDATIYLMSNDYSKGSLFGARLTKESSPVLIGYTTDALRWQFDAQPTDDTLRGTANYLLWLCGKYRLEATSLSGGGSVIPVSPGSAPSPRDFYVDSNTLVATGASTVVIPSFIGYNLSFNRNNIPQATVSDGMSTYFTWDKVTGTFTCFGAAAEGELFSLNPYL